MGCYISYGENSLKESLSEMKRNSQENLYNQPKHYSFNKSLFNNEYAQDVKIGQYMDENISSNKIISKWNNILRFID